MGIYGINARIKWLIGTLNTKAVRLGEKSSPLLFISRKMRLYFRGDPAIYSREDRIYCFFCIYANFDKLFLFLFLFFLAYIANFAYLCTRKIETIGVKLQKSSE